MKKHLLTFILEKDFGSDLKLVSSNPIDLEDYLLEKGYTDIEFSDLESSYGTCILKDQYGKMTAKCSYVELI